MLDRVLDILCEIRYLEVVGEFELVPDLEVPPPQHRRVYRQQHGFVASLLGALDQLAAVLLLLEQVQLQDVGDVAARGTHVLERARREAAQAHHDALGRARPRRRELAVRVCEPLHRRRRHPQRYGVAVPKHRHARVDLRDVPQHPRPDPVPPVCGFILCQRAAAVCPFVVVVPCLLVHALVRQRCEFADREAVEVVLFLLCLFGRHGWCGSLWYCLSLELICPKVGFSRSSSKDIVLDALMKYL